MPRCVAPTLRAGALALTLLGAALPAGAATADTATDAAAAGLLTEVFHRPVCAPTQPGRVRCLSDVVTDPAGSVLAKATPSGFGPADLRSAYGVVVAALNQGAGHTIAIVAAYDNPTAESDLSVYRAQYGLPPCTSANGCFTKRDQNGGVAYPVPDEGWGGEIALDLAMASAMCPNCKLLLVEAKSNSTADVGAAVRTAASLGATEISNSYGTPEYSGMLGDEQHYNQPGIALTASSGDSGYRVEFPAASRFVTAVGGTSLVRAPTSERGWTETAWSRAGSGCSAYVPKPAWQSDAGCGGRTVADVAAVADPATGVAVFHTDGTNPASSGWLIFGGTSVSAPIVAGIYALRGHGASNDPVHDLAPFVDVTSGSNGSCGNYLCQAGPGFDGPTGMGSPSGGERPPTQSRPSDGATGTGDSAGSSAGSSAPVSSSGAPPSLTTKRAAVLARRKLLKAFGSRFGRRRVYRSRCTRRDRVTATCRVSWWYRGEDYRGSVTIRHTTISAGGTVKWRGSYTVKKVSRHCRAARPKRRCKVREYRQS